jgi:cyclomaltodextrin glucanotransferase
MAIKAWLDLGVDALRIDTLKHMPVWFWQEFVADIQAHQPRTFLFGEYGFGSPWDGRCVRYANDTGISILDFGLCGAIRAAFSGQEPGGFHLVEKILGMDWVYCRSTELVTFIENHDMPRFLSVCPSWRDLELATVLLLTMRGIPCLFYGCEQYLVNNTQAGDDPYNRPMMEQWDPSTSLFSIVRTLSRLRTRNRAVSYGRHVQKCVSENVYAYTRIYRENRVFVVINKAEGVVVDIENIDFPDGSRPCLLQPERTVTIDRGAIRGLSLPGKGAYVLAVEGEPLRATTVVKFQINDYVNHAGEVMAVCGDVPELRSWDLDRAPRLESINGDTWFGEVGFHASAGMPIHFKFVVIRSAGQEPVYENLVCRTFLLPGSGSVKLALDWNHR